MKIADVITEEFHYTTKIVRDSEGHAHPGPEHTATQCLLRIVTSEGAVRRLERLCCPPEVLVGDFPISNLAAHRGYP